MDEFEFNPEDINTQHADDDNNVVFMNTTTATTATTAKTFNFIASLTFPP